MRNRRVRTCGQHTFGELSVCILISTYPLFITKGSNESQLVGF